MVSGGRRSAWRICERVAMQAQYIYSRDAFMYIARRAVVSFLLCTIIYICI